MTRLPAADRSARLVFWRSLLASARMVVDQRRARARGAVPASMPLLYMEVIKACNLRCKMCGYPSAYPGRGKRLSTAEIERIVTDATSELGTQVVSYGGGEPFLRRDIVELIAIAEGNGATVHINTNGTQIDAAMCDRLADSRGPHIALSLDHAEPSRNDAIRGEGVFAAVEQAARLLRERVPQATVGLNCVVGPHNLGQIDALVDLASRWRLAAIKFLPLHSNLQHAWMDGLAAEFTTDAAGAPALGAAVEAARIRARALGLSTSSRAFVRGIAPYLEGKLHFDCYAGYLYGNVDPFGMLFPCYDHAEPLDIREVGIVAAWRGETMQRMRERVRGCANPCWNSGNAEPSLRMDAGAVLGDPLQIIDDLELLRP